MAAEQRAHRVHAAHLVEGAAQLRLEEDDRRDHDRLGPVAEDELEQPQVQQLRAVPDREDHRQPEQQLHRLGAANQLEQLIQEERDHQHIEHVAPADVLEEEVEVAQELAHPTPPL